MAEVILIEDRPKQLIAYQINFNVYLGANVRLLSDWRDVREAVTGAAEHKWDLIVTRAQMGGIEVLPELARHLIEKGEKIPVISLGGEEFHRKKIVGLKEPFEMKTLLSEAAKILGVSPETMARQKIPEWFPIPTVFFRYLIYYPCDIHDDPKGGNGADPRLRFKKDALIDPAAAEQVIHETPTLFIRSKLRLRFANSLTEQLMSVGKKLAGEETPVTERVALLDVTINRLAAQFQKGGVDEQTIEVARSCISSMEKVAEAFPTVAELMDRLMKDKVGYRYSHSQLITFLALHLAKVAGELTKEREAAIPHLAFFHDIALASDAEARVMSQEELDRGGFADEEKARILGHADAAAKILSESFPHVGKEASDVARRHHGKADGKGFGAGSAQFGVLEKIFMTAEAYANYLLGCVKDGRKPDKAAFLATMQSDNADEISLQMIQALGVIEMEDFVKDLGNLAVEVQKLQADEAIDARIAEIAAADGLAGREWAAIRYYGEKFNELLTIGADALPPGEREAVKGAARAIEECRTIVKGVIEKGGDDATVVKGVTQEIVATKATISMKAERIEANGESLRVESRLGATDLMIASKVGDVDRAMKLLASGNTNVRDAEGRTAMHYAAMGGKVEILSALTTRGLSNKATDSKRRTPLYFAVFFGRNAAVDFLLEQGANVHQQSLRGMNMLMVAAYRGNLHAVKALRKAGAKLNARDYGGATVFDYAEQGSNPELAQFLAAESGASPEDAPAEEAPAATAPRAKRAARSSGPASRGS